MRRYLLLAILGTIATSSHAGESAREHFDYQNRVGIAEVNADGGCLTVMNTALRKNDKIKLITLQRPQTIIETTIVEKLSRSCSKNSVSPPEASFYSFRIPDKEVFSGLAIAITGFRGNFTVVDGMVHADLNGDGRRESFRSCAGNEGLHLTVWAGMPLKSKRLWHEYYYLGYDVEPNCTPKDYE